MSGLFSKHSVVKSSTALTASLMATLVAVSLSGWTSVAVAADDTHSQAGTADGSAPAVGAGQPRQGPHGGGHDPHANLTADKQVQVALQHLAEDRPAQAMETLNQAIEKYPNSAALRGVRGSLLLEQGSSAAALADLNRAVALDPHNPVYLTNRAQAYRGFGSIDEAQADLDSAIELDSGFVAARFNRGSLAFNAGRYDQALADFDACVAAEPQSAAPYFNRAAVHNAMGNRELAIADLERFLEIASSETWKDAARALLQKWQDSAPTAAQADPS